jgi:hypothetical protein
MLLPRSPAPSAGPSGSVAGSSRVRASSGLSELRFVASALAENSQVNAEDENPQGSLFSNGTIPFVSSSQFYYPGAFTGS